MSNVVRDSDPTTDEIFASLRRMLSQELGSATDECAAPDNPEARTSSENETSNAKPTLHAPGVSAVPCASSERSASKGPVAPKKPVSTREDRLISEDAAVASVTALSHLMGERTPTTGEAALLADHMLESGTRRLLSRLMKAWVDATLPSLVESILRDEIRSVVGAAAGPTMMRNGIRADLPPG